MTATVVAEAEAAVEDEEKAVAEEMVVAEVIHRLPRAVLLRVEILEAVVQVVGEILLVSVEIMIEESAQLVEPAGHLQAKVKMARIEERLHCVSVILEDEEGVRTAELSERGTGLLNGRLRLKPRNTAEQSLYQSTYCTVMYCARFSKEQLWNTLHQSIPVLTSYTQKRFFLHFFS